MPSEASLKIRQYYGHPRNQFWKILCSILEIDWKIPYPERCETLIHGRLALWDVVADCERQGSLDTNILSEKPNTIDLFLDTHRSISRIVFNGGPACRLFRRHFPTLYVNESYNYRILPSTSPACARYTFDVKLSCWRNALLGT